MCREGLRVCLGEKGPFKRRQNAAFTVGDINEASLDSQQRLLCSSPVGSSGTSLDGGAGDR